MPRTFLTTGAGKDIGLALSHRLAEQGHTVIGIARKAPEAFPGALHPLQLADPVSGERLAVIIGDAGVDGVINNVVLVRSPPWRA